MKAGDRIRLDIENDRYSILGDFKVEEFRFCLGVFLSEEHRIAGEFIPLCGLYGSGLDSEEKELSHYGTYTTNQVPLFMNIP